MFTPGSLISKLTAIAILLLLLFSAVMFAVMPIAAKFRSQEQRIEELSGLIARFDGEVRALSSNPEDQDSLAPEKAVLINAPNELAATAVLQKAIKASFDASQVAMMRVSFLPPTVIDEMRLLSLSFQARGDLASLQKALHRLEASDPPVFVDAIFLRRQSTPAESTDDAPKDDADRVLIADISLSGLWTAERAP